MSKTKYVCAFEQIMVVGARRTGLCQGIAILLGFSRSTVSRVYQEWSVTQRTSSQLDTTVGSIGVSSLYLPGWLAGWDLVVIPPEGSVPNTVVLLAEVEQ